MQDSGGKKWSFPALESTQNPKRYKRITPIKQIDSRIGKCTFSPAVDTN